MRIDQLQGLLFVCVSASLVGCGGDDGQQCTGHGACGTSPFELEEGGEVRIIQTTFYDGTPVRVDAQAFFFRNQQPASRPFVGEVVDGACEDWASGDIFDNGPTAQAIAIVDTREYIDVGDSVVLRQGASTFTLAEQENFVDVGNFLQHDRMYYAEIPKADAPVNVAYTIDGLVATNGVDPLSNPAEDNELYMPADFDIVSPAVTTEMVVPAGQDVSFQWGRRPAGAPQDITFLAFLDTDTGVVKGQCLSAPNTGNYTVPAAMMARMGTSGSLLVGTFVHHAYDYDGRRLDVLGINCHLFPWRAQ